MLIKGRAFDSARRFYSTHMSLCPIVGNGDWFTEFQPQGFVVFGLMFHLLCQLLDAISVPTFRVPFLHMLRVYRYHITWLLYSQC